ncbi:MAG TPA: MarR family transcriptional regulator [Nitrososphaerales archaeon]|nr:MarR family transcriptional regulator [Nitrososphaerales archaeon]
MLKLIDWLINPPLAAQPMPSTEVGDLILALWQRWRAASPVRRGAVTREQYWIMRTLMDRGSLRIKDLATAIGCTAGSASVAVKRMERSGLVRRVRGRKDERVVTVTLAKDGSKVLGSWRKRQLDSMDALFETLSRDEMKSLRRLLEKALSQGAGEVQSSDSPSEATN